MEIEIEVPEKVSGAMSNFLVERGAQGVWEASSAPSVIKAYFPREGGAELEFAVRSYYDSLGEIYSRLPSLYLSRRSVKDDDWANRWKDFFKPQKLGQHFYLLPSWLRGKHAVPSDRQLIIMDPGMAFGTGLHPTSQLCIEILEKMGPTAETELLDAGTGSGILAIVARKLGVLHIDAIDVDADAVEVARENCKVNACEGVRLSVIPVGRVHKQYDLIIANILLETHEQALPVYRRCLKPGGQLVLSGLLGEQETRIRQKLGENDFRVLESHSRDQWLALLSAV